MKTKTIILIEDDHNILSLYTTILESAGFNIVPAMDGREGFDKIKVEKPDLILLDLMMPNLGGSEMLRMLRKETYGKYLPVIILTNIGKSEVPQDVQNLGVSKILVKVNLTPDLLVKNVKEVLA